MKTVIESTLNTSHEKFTEMMVELNCVIDILNRNTVLGNAYMVLKAIKFKYIEFGRGSSHIWVKFCYKGKLSDRILFATEN